jgi:hypothetical protein
MRSETAMPDDARKRSRSEVTTEKRYRRSIPV